MSLHKNNGYINTREIEQMEEYIVLPSLNDDQGIMGAVKLAMEEVEYEKKNV